MCSSSPPAQPAAPNYSQAATDTAKSQMSSQYTPYGNQVYSPDANSPSGFRSDISLAPSAQNTLNSQMALSQNLGNLANDQLGRVNQQYSQPMDMSSVQKVADQSYQQQTSRLDPQWAARDEQEKSALANQGLVAGGQAYDNAYRDFSNARNDAYDQARTSANNTMPQTYQLASSVYNQPLNTLNAIRTGAQVQNPTFQQTPGANQLGAAQAQGTYNQGLYNAQVGQQNAMTSGLFGLGAAGIGAFA